MTQTSHRLFVWMGKYYFFFLRRKAIPAPIPTATPARPTGRSIHHALPVEAGSVGSAAGSAVAVSYTHLAEERRAQLLAAERDAGENELQAEKGQNGDKAVHQRNADILQGKRR